MRSFVQLGIAVLLAFAAYFTGPSMPAAQPKFFRIGTGGVAGTYYPIGGLIAQAISQFPESQPCPDGETCGIPGFIAIPQSSNGSVANIDAIIRGTLESGFVQSDIVYWAYSGTGVFTGSAPKKELRAITNLYQETIHLVAGKNAGISQIGDLSGKRVSLDEPGSGTLVDSRLALSAFDMSDQTMHPEYIKPDLAVDKIINGKLDAYFIIAGSPTGSVTRLANGPGAVLVPIAGKRIDALIEKFPYFSHAKIPAGTYKNVDATETISVGAQWIVSEAVPPDLVYAITKALWSTHARRILDSGHPKGKVIRLERALQGVSIPLHPGAERFYKEVGLIK